MSTQMQQRTVPLDYNHLGGADQNNYYNNNNNNNFNNANAMNNYPRGSYMNETNNNYNPNFANQTQRMNNNFGESNFNNFNANNQQNMSNTFNNNNNNYNYNGNNQQNMSNTLNNNNYNINNNTNMNMNQNYNMNNQQNNNNYEQNINTGMNEYVRKELSSHGNNPIYSPSPNQFRKEEQERKKMLLNNIQSQINLNKKSKLEELRKRQEEDAKYLRDMVVCFPFGRGGGGAPIRDKSGNIVTTRRALISDPKYNLASINVDDDYNDVWDKEKRIGRFYRNNSQYDMRTNNINLDNNFNNNQQLSNTTQNFGGMNYNNQGGYNNQNYFYNTQQQNIGRPYSTNPRLMNNNNFNNNYNYNNGQTFENNNFNQQQDINNNYSNKQQFFNTMQQPNTQTISLTYDNFEVMNRDQQRQIKDNYRQDLLNQIKENENKKLLEKKRKELEEAREEERIRKERDELEKRELEEKNRNQQLRNKVRNENNLLILEKNNRNNNNNNNNINNNINNDQNVFKNVKTINRTIRINEVNENNNAIDQEAIDKINQKEMESKMQLNNEILKLREQMKDQQNDLFSQISFLKQETQNANKQRFEALKEIEQLKEELSKQRADENLRRKYVYDVVVNDTKNTNNIFQETHLPKQEKPEIILPVKSEKDIYYDEKIRHPNRIIPVPKLTELYEHGMKTDSKFIDMDTHNIFGGLELYEPKNKIVDSQDDDYKINNRGIGIDGDYGTLRDYNDQNILKTSDVFLNNSNNLNKNTVNISINNKNVKSFKNVQNVETKKDGRTESININLSTDTDGQFEVNKIYNRNLERLRHLNDIDNNYDSKNERNLINKNINEKDNFDEFIRKLNKPTPIITKESKDDEFEIEISRIPK